jgi:hypothetical protein
VKSENGNKNDYVRDIQQMLISSFLSLLVPLRVSASRCHLQGTTISLFISYSRVSVFRVPLQMATPDEQ